MKPWITIGEAKAPDGTKLVLQQRGEEFGVRAGGFLLMGSRTHGSEEAMADAALEGLRKSAPTVLIGGLGLGYTLRAILDKVSPESRVVVAELIPEVVEWARGPTAHLANNPLKDRRVEVVVGDVVKLMRERSGTFDAALLDVDNGPAALTQKGNVAVYSESGLKILRSSLRARGRAVIWSAKPDFAFLRKFGRAGFHAEMRNVPAGKSGSAQHTLFIGQV